MIQLLPCPFCGSANIDPEGWASTDRAGPACDDCSGSADTIELWNSRPHTAALARKPAGEWQPIETAPKDQIVDLWHPTAGRYTDCRYEPSEYAPGIPWGWATQRLGRVCAATHWMPLPAAPNNITEPTWRDVGNPNLKPSFVIVEKSDYEGGDPSLDIEERSDGLYDLVIYKGTNDLTVHAVSREQVLRGARDVIALLSNDNITEPCPYCEGLGFVPSGECAQCAGTGSAPNNITIRAPK